VWDKKNISENFSMAMCEYAWTSFDDNAKIAGFAPQGTAKEKRIHPTQKPVALYKWTLARYAKPGDKILDTHAGSASCLVACHELGFDFTGFEIDKHYFDLAQERLAAVTAQTRMEFGQ
jgi:site-specific DNA-methyltransferase (adenine-specific)